MILPGRRNSGIRKLPGPIVDNGSYFVVLLDTSRSMRETRVAAEETLFSLQLAQVNSFGTALFKGKNNDKMQLLFVHFDGVVAQGWTPLAELPRLKDEDLPESACSPVLDTLSAALELFEKIKIEAMKKQAAVNCGLLVVTDGLDGITIGDRSYPISVRGVEDVRKQIARFQARDYHAHALAIGSDGGAEVSDFFLKLGFEPDLIFKSGLNESELRKQFNVASQSLVSDLYA